MKVQVLGRPGGHLLFSHPKSPIICLAHQNPLAKNPIFYPEKPYRRRTHASSSAAPLATSAAPSRRAADAPAPAPARPSPSSLYSRPSLQQMKTERAANRARVYEFLRSLGVVPDELDGLELPVTVDVMRERVDFLHSLGLTVDDINSYPLVLGCSVKKNIVPVLDYLGKLGVRKATFTEFLRRYPQVLHSSVVVDLMPVVKYLQGLDIRPNDIPRVLERYPEVLGFKLEGTMSTSVAYLVGIGVGRREIGGVLTRYPEILGMRVGKVIKPFVEYLESIGLPRLAVARLIEKRPHILGFSLEEQVKPNVEALLEFGVRQEAAASVIAQYPDIMGLELKATSQQSLFESNILVDHDEFGRVIEKMPHAVSLSRSTVLKHVDFLKGCGFLLNQVGRMVVGCPQLLALNLDIMKMSFEYFQSEMDRDLEELVAFPAFFTYGLESTVRPRHRIIAKRGIKCSLAWLLNCSDEKFEERMKYDSIGVEEMETEPSFDMKSLLQPTKDEESTSEYDDSDYEDTEEYL
ncbi:mitochondrial transcription termination factor family protein [Musa troglodytarum]|uniref:Transcription termination factor MTERF4, chloroplastic n=1 Tax=Musa troglodytarum TaxID=320322 RepID=A0A9E7E9P2_9LILI|nr:mitochondrial transcription termination factor family protein [Musa troglodytarum]